MKTILSSLVMLAVLSLAACGGGGSSNSNQSSTASGNWSARLTTASTGQQSLAFNFAMNQSGNSLSMSNLTFSNGGNCFGSGSMMVGTMMASGTMSGMQMQMTMDVWSNSNQTGNHLTMPMGMPMSDSNQMTGTFTLVGTTSGCSSQAGTVIMSRM